MLRFISNNPLAAAITYLLLTYGDNIISAFIGNMIFPNTPDMIEKFAKKMQELGVKPEIEVYELGHIETAKKHVIDKGYLDSKPQFSLVLGTAGGAPATPKSLIAMREALPDDCTWHIIAIGRHEIPIGTMGIILGGNVRVGFEDNVYLEKGVLAKSNAVLVEKIAKIARELGKKIADIDDAREILSLKR
jgi:3-keto-5-aminohexanoate cleavage enzyme